MERMHPMTKKARREFEEALMTGTPARWVMINKPKIRNVQEAVNLIKKHCRSYQDISEKYNAMDVLSKELEYERQLVLDKKRASDAVAALSNWYNRSRKQMSHRYQAIMHEAEQMPSIDLAMERREFVSNESKNETCAPTQTTEDTIGMEDYARLSIMNIQKRISSLMNLQVDLQLEMGAECGRLMEIKKEKEEIQKKIDSIMVFKEVKASMTSEI